MAADKTPDYTGPELCRKTARDVVALLKSGEISPSDLVEASLERIAQTSPAVNAMVTPVPERARAAAAAASSDSLLAGLPIGIKDLVMVAGVRSTCGTPALKDHVPEVSDPLVLRLEERGGIVMGKTNTPEMGAGANTFNPIFGATRNPWNTAMNPAGSSGGAAVGLAVGEVWLSHGSDLGGSLRSPACYCGIVGLRPSPGIAGGATGPDSFDAFGVEGPMARNVADCALMLDAMAGYDPVWPVSYPAPETSYLTQCLSDPGQIRIAFSPDLGGLSPVEPEVAAMLQTAMQTVEAPDVSVTEETPPLDGVESCFRTLRAIDKWMGYKTTPKEISDLFKPTLRGNIDEGAVLSGTDIVDARIIRMRLYAEMQSLLSRYDVLACPVVGLAPLPVEIEYPTEVNGVPCKDYLDWLRFAFLASLCGLPALSLPIGRTAEGLPMGIQLIGPPRGEGRLLQVARRLEQALNAPATPIDPMAP